MGGLIGGGGAKAVKPPPVSPPVAIPEVGEEVKTQARKRRPRGFRETFLTGDLIPETEKKTKLA